MRHPSPSHRHGGPRRWRGTGRIRRRADGRAALAVGADAVERARHDARRRRLADAAHAGEDEGMRDAAGGDGVGRACAPSLPARSARRRCSAGICARARDRRRPARSCCLRGGLRDRGGRLDNDPGRNSLRLLPSGPDRVGEGPVHRQPPEPTISGSRRHATRRDKPARLDLVARISRRRHGGGDNEPQCYNPSSPRKRGPRATRLAVPPGVPAFAGMTKFAIAARLAPAPACLRGEKPLAALRSCHAANPAEIREFLCGRGSIALRICARTAPGSAERLAHASLPFRAGVARAESDRRSRRPDARRRAFRRPMRSIAAEQGHGAARHRRSSMRLFRDRSLGRWKRRSTLIRDAPPSAFIDLRRVGPLLPRERRLDARLSRAA